jgi:GT2 family glycosyltransferase
VPGQPAASIVIPTRSRPEYLEVTLASVTPQATDAGAEVIVVNDGGSPSSARVAERHGARVVALPAPGGANAARNVGIDAATGDLIVLIDDDVFAPPGWLAEMLAGVERSPGYDLFGGPIRARLEGGGPRSCGRESAPITTLDLGSVDRDAELVWSANMAIRRSALERVGRFDETIRVRGDEEDWERRYVSAGGRVRYLAAAGLEHRRAPADATLRRLARGPRGAGPGGGPRLRPGPGGAPLRRGQGLRAAVAGRAAHSRRLPVAHRPPPLRQRGGARRSRAGAPARGSDRSPAVSAAANVDDFMSGTSGQVHGVRATTRAIVADGVCDAIALAHLTGPRLSRAAAAGPPRRVLALGIERDDVPNVLGGARSELLCSRHEVRFASTLAGARGKFENLNELLADNPPAAFDWLLIVDDDVVLPRDFLNRFLFLAERFDLTLAQPAHRWRSHAAYGVTRRRPGAVLHETAFVEIGPLCALRAPTFGELLPFPPLRAGWGLDSHWSAVARSRGWRLGVVDATPMRHGLRRIASSYSREAAVAEARAFLAERPFTAAREARRPLAVHRSWR